MKTPLADKFLEMYDQYCTNSADRALYILLKNHKENIEPLFESKDPAWFHKAFRQTDVCEPAYVDSLVWHLIDASRDFWDTLYWFWNSYLDKKSERRMSVQLLEKDARISELEEKLKLYEKE